MLEPDEVLDLGAGEEQTPALLEARQFAPADQLVNPLMGTVTIGIDVGQKHDPTAIVVAEADGSTPPRFSVRALERLPLGTRYPDVADRLAEVVERVIDRTGTSPYSVTVDATGVGAPVVDLLRQRLSAGPYITAATFTHGDRLIREAGWLRVGKGHLVSRLQVLLQEARLLLPDTSEALQLVEELLAFEIRIQEDGNERYGAFKVGKHDDLVVALGLAVLVDPPSLCWPSVPDDDDPPLGLAGLWLDGWAF